MANSWLDIEERIITNPRYTQILQLIKKNKCDEFIRGLPPFGKHSDKYSQYAYGYEGFYFVANSITVALQSKELKSAVLDTELLNMTKDKNFAVLALRYVEYYLDKYCQLDVQGEKLWELDYKSIISSFNEQRWEFEDNQLNSFKIKLCNSINNLTKAVKLTT